MTAIQAIMERELGHAALELLGEQTAAALLVPADRYPVWYRPLEPGQA